MIVQNNFTGQVAQAVRMAWPFAFQGREHPAGDVVLLRPAPRAVVSAAYFRVAFTELLLDAEGVLCDPEEVIVR